MTRPMSRRRTLQLAAAGLAGAVTGGIGLSRTGLPWAPATSARRTGLAGQDLVQPEVIRSENGLLKVELVTARRELDLAGGPARMLTYNGSLPGPTWRVRPGDRLQVRVTNQLAAATNLHTHGLAVSPRGNGDNPFVSIAPGESFDYVFEIPPDHPTGVFWYHPHLHGVVADQVFGGLYGTIIVDDGASVPVARERVLVVSDTSVTANGDLVPVSTAELMAGREGDLLLVNGQFQPRLSARSGERERWRVVNACASRYLRLAVPGQRVELLGIDSGHEPSPRSVDEVLLAPGNRADLLVTMKAGTSQLTTLGYDRTGGMMAMMGNGDLSGPATAATVVVAGEQTPALEPIPQRGADRDLRGRVPDNRRDISFTMTMGGGGGMMRFGFDGRGFDAGRTDQVAAVGAVEEWTIRNPTPMDHPFHLHVWPMQVVEDNGAPVDAPTWRDVVNVRAGGQVRVLVDFTRHPGRTVYHCHILDHEDAGMMATVEAR